MGSEMCIRDSLNCAHRVVTAISRIALRANDAFTTPKQRSPRLNYAPFTLVVRLIQALITRQLRWPRPDINTVQRYVQHHLFCNCRAVHDKVTQLFCRTMPPKLPKDKRRGRARGGGRAVTSKKYRSPSATSSVALEAQHDERSEVGAWCDGGFNMLCAQQ